MQKLSEKVNDSAGANGELPAEEWSNHAKEIENVVTEVEPLDAQRSNQLVNAIKSIITTAITAIDFSLYALKNGTASNKFAVANGIASKDAVNRGQLDSVANTKANSSHTHPYLPLTGTAVDSDKLGGELPSRYIPQLLYKTQNPSINLSTTPVNYMNTWFAAKGEVCLLQNICSVYSDTTTLMDVVVTTKLYNYTKGVFEGIPQETRMSIRNTFNSAVLVNVLGHSFMTQGDTYVLQIFVSRTSSVGLVKLQRIQSSGIVQ